MSALSVREAMIHLQQQLYPYTDDVLISGSLHESSESNALDRMVQLTSETNLDASTGDHWDDLADSLPDHSH